MEAPRYEFDIHKRLLQNSALIFVCRVTTMLISLVTVPIIVGKLGLVGYGIWESILAVSVLCMLFSNVIRGTLLWRISSAFGVRNHAETRRLVGLGVSSSLIFFLLMTPVIFGFRYPILHLLKVPPEHILAVSWILPSIAGLTILGCINETMGAVLGGYQRVGITSIIQSAALILFNFAVIGGLFLGCGLWSLLAGTLCSVAFSGVAFFWSARATCQHISLRPRLPSSEDLRQMGPYAGLLFTGQVASSARDPVDRLVLSAFGNPALVGYYGIALRLASLVLLVCTFFYGPFTAAASALNSAGDKAGLRRMYLNIVTLLVFFGGLLAVGTGAVWDRIVVFWMGHPMPEVGPIFFVLLFGFTAAVFFTGGGSSLCLGLGRADIDTGYTVFGLFANVILKIILIAAFGGIGSVMASSASWFLASLVLLGLIYRHLDFPLDATFSALKAFGLAVAIVVLMRLVLQAFPTPDERWQAFGSGLFFGTIAIALYLFSLVAFGVIERSRLKNAFRRLAVSR
jgi:O-antigen/teichoic acid export membrane protein